MMVSPEITSSGCTDYTEFTGIGYPYLENPVTIPLETDYLLDVVTAEMNPTEYELTAVQAQMVAARTYALFRMEERRRDVETNNPPRLDPINNSVELQLFVPYRFEKRLGYTPPDPAQPCSNVALVP